MLAGKNEFNNEDPLADLVAVLALYTVRAALLLVNSNWVGIFPTVIAIWLHCYFLAAALIASFIVSGFFYHLCQTTHECFQYKFIETVLADHFTATLLLGLFWVTKFNVRTACQVLHSRLNCFVRPLDCNDDCVTPSVVVVYQYAAVLDIDHCHCGYPRQTHFAYMDVGDNGIYDAWSAASSFAIVVITFLAVLAHPFSYAAFNIVMASCMIIAFYKVAWIEEGEPANFHGRISWPELLIGFGFAIAGLAAYVIDSYAEYEILHPIWHIAIYLYMGFDMIGTMKGVYGWRPLIKCKCC